MPADEIVVTGAREHNLKNIDVAIPRTRSDRASPGSRARASPRSPSTRSTPRASGATSSRSPPTRGSSCGRWRSPTSTRSRGSRRRSPSSRRRPRATRARPSARSPRSTTTCACSSPAIGQPALPDLRQAHRGARRSQQMVDAVLTLPEGTQFMVLAPVVRGRKGEYQGDPRGAAEEGFARVRVDGEVVRARRRARSSTSRRSTRSRSWSTASCRSHDMRRSASPTRSRRRSTLADGIVIDRRRCDGEATKTLFSRAARLPGLRHLASRARAAHLLLQLAATAPARDCDGLGMQQEIDPELLVPDRR